MELPFPLRKYHKRHTFWNWDRYGIIFESEEHREEIYQQYIYSTNCELCGIEYPNSLDRKIDHEHILTKPNFRNIVCSKCNSHKKDKKRRPNNTGEEFIFKCKDKTYTQGFCFRIRISRNGINPFDTRRKTMEDAIIVRDKFIKENPGVYT